MTPDSQTGITDSVLDLIGKTPLLRLNRIGGALQAGILAKLEYLSPSGSIKDRMASQIIQDAEKAGSLKSGGVVLESSSGNTGIALSMVCAVKGLRMKIYYPETVWPPEKKRTVERFGGEIEMVPLVETQAARDAGVHGARVEIPGRIKCKEEEEADPNAFWARQFSNPSNVAGQSEIGREIVQQTDGRIDVFVASIGTGGTFLGVSQVLKEALPHVRVIAVQPSGWPGWVNPLSPEARYISGITGGIIEEIRDSGIADQVVSVSNEEARDMMYRLSREEGLLCGMSSGANVKVALDEASKLGEGANVVTVLVDSGDRYFSSERYTT